MSQPLFYLPALPAASEIFLLTGDEARHAAGSRRLNVGDVLWLFDGRGGIAHATVRAIENRGRELRLELNERRIEPPPRPAVHLACAIPKGDRQAALLDMATQLGMTNFTPLICERSVAQPSARADERWRRICLEACKQSRRLYLPMIHPPATPSEVAVRATALAQETWLAHPTGEAVPVCALKDSAKDVTLMVGPEGGFTDEEMKSAVAAGAKTIGLGQAILRIETAAAALLAVMGLPTDRHGA